MLKSYTIAVVWSAVPPEGTMKILHVTAVAVVLATLIEVNCAVVEAGTV